MKFKVILFAIIFTLMAQNTFAKAYDLDKAHSQIAFSVKHLVISNVRGEFTEFNGVFETDSKDNIKAISIKIDADSIFTRNEKRDKHLRSPDFLDTDKFPKIVFTYKRTLYKEGNEYTVSGDLTIHGITKEVILELEILGKVLDPWGNERLGFTGETKIIRKNFGLIWNKALETGGVLVGDIVKINIEGEGIMQKNNELTKKTLVK